MAQLDFLVGDIEGNAQKVCDTIATARKSLKADLIIFPELTLTGYPPEDLLFRPTLFERIAAVLPLIAAETKEVDVILGYPEKTLSGTFNQAVLFHKGNISTYYHKQLLPNYSVFDEVRYFRSGSKSCIFDLHGIPTALLICEDLWSEEPLKQAREMGAQLAISINASPFDTDKAELREKVIGNRSKENQLPILYVNCVGAQDELVFDGGSFVINKDRQITHRAPAFAEALIPVDIEWHRNDEPSIHSGTVVPLQSMEERIYNALVLGVRDYIEKNHFPRALIGLSGGIDSALTLAIAVDAIGKDRVEAIMMPSRYTAEMSLEDAKKQALDMGVTYNIIPIEPIFQAFLDSLASEFAGFAPDVTEENLQARCRGSLLMAISNKKNALVLTTGNKSEMAVGYSTLYGDMVGGFCVLKDVFKTMVYRLAHYRNSISPIIPERVITRPPSAELAENQKDEDYLPPYPILDIILERYIERDEGIYTIAAAGFDEALVRKIAKMVYRSEYKRRQAAPGVKITQRAFGKDRRYPITSGYIKRI
jgi:NAD+ synthase (glutamine-hydrolysing)